MKFNQSIVFFVAIFAISAHSKTLEKSRGSYKNDFNGFYLKHFDRIKIPHQNSILKNVFRSGKPDYSNTESIKTLNDNGIKYVVNLQAEERNIAKLTKLFSEKGITLIHLPLDTGENKKKGVNDPQKTLDVLNRIEDLLSTKPNDGVLVHCQRGEDRTGVFIRLLRESNGESVASTTKDFKNYGGVLYKPLQKLYEEVKKIE